MGDTRSAWSSKIVREHTASRLERLKEKQAMKKQARGLNADVMSAKTSATRVAAVFSDTDSSDDEGAQGSIAGEDMEVVPLRAAIASSERSSFSAASGLGAEPRLSRVSKASKASSRQCVLLPLPLPPFLGWLQLPPWVCPPSEDPAVAAAAAATMAAAAAASAAKRPGFEELNPPIPGWLEVVREPASSTTLDLSADSGAKAAAATDETLALASKRACGSLQQLNLTGCVNVTPASVLAVCKANPRMQVVRVARGTPWGPGAITQVLDAAPELKSLEVDSACRRMDETVAALLEHPTVRMRQLAIVGKMGATTVNEMLAVPLAHSTLRRLVLANCGVGAEGAKMLARVLQQPGSVLRLLDVSSCKIGAPGAKAIAEALRFNTALRRLDVSRNQITNDGAIAIARALGKDNKTLRELGMARNGIGLEGIREVSAMIQNNSVLELLNLADNECGTVAGKMLAAALKRNRRLQQLMVQGNMLGAAGHDFVAMMRESKTLWKIDIHNNEMPDGVSRELAVLALQALLRGDPRYDSDDDERFEEVEIEVDEAQPGDESASESDSSGSEDGDSSDSEEELDEPDAPSAVGSAAKGSAKGSAKN